MMPPPNSSAAIPEIENVAQRKGVKRKREGDVSSKPGDSKRKKPATSDSDPPPLTASKVEKLWQQHLESETRKRPASDNLTTNQRKKRRVDIDLTAKDEDEEIVLIKSEIKNDPVVNGVYAEDTLRERLRRTRLRRELLKTEIEEADLEDQLREIQHKKAADKPSGIKREVKEEN